MKIVKSRQQKYFNSRPHKEVDSSSEYICILNFEFQFTTSQGGRPSLNKLYCFGFLFQFTTSQGGRLTPFIDFLFRVGFQFTTSQGGRHNLFKEAMKAYTFQFTTSQGGRHIQVFSSYYGENFNSRPHKEVDQSHYLPSCSIRISIHDLTRRSTMTIPDTDTARRISIHDLTRRSTCPPYLPHNSS